MLAFHYMLIIFANWIIGSCFFSLCGMSWCVTAPSHVLVVVLFGFLVWAVFQLLLGWGKWNFHLCAYVGLCWLGWDEDGIICWNKFFNTLVIQPVDLAENWFLGSDMTTYCRIVAQTTNKTSKINTKPEFYSLIIAEFSIGSRGFKLRLSTFIWRFFYLHVFPQSSRLRNS